MTSSAEAIAAVLPETTSRFAARLRAGEFPGTRSTVASGAASLTHIADTAERARLDTGVLDAGHGDDGLARLARRLTP